MQQSDKVITKTGFVVMFTCSYAIPALVRVQDVFVLRAIELHLFASLAINQVLPSIITHFLA